MEPTAAAESTALTGRTLGDFVVREAIGSGGFGTIYRAEQPLLAREVVVKVVRAGTTDEASVQRFLREARLASRLDHPYAAHVYAFGAEPGGLLWIAMEWVRGTSLQEVLKSRGPVPLAQFVPFLERVCEVVFSAHEQGIVHRDLKPANIMVLSRAGRMLPKLLDFGIAKLEAPNASGTEQPAALAEHAAEAVPDIDGWSDLTLDQQLGKAESVVLTRAGKFMGSPHYMAPEQWVDASSAGPRCDLYALGILCFQALTGKVPFDGASLRVIARHHAKSPLPPLPAGLPHALSEVLTRAAAKSPDDRFPTALALGQAFRAASGLGTSGEPLPQLAESIRVEFITAAPQPLADAVTALEAARSGEEAIGAVSHISRAVFRYLGALALACRARVGPGARTDSPAVVDLLRRLRWEALAPEGWLSLCRELCRPFTRARDAYPLPELVTLFFEPGGEAAAPAQVAFDYFATAWPAAAQHARGAATISVLAQALPHLERLLSALAFLFDYPLVVARQGGADMWTGARRERRQRVTVSEPLPEHTVALLSREGNPVLTLSPLAQALVPTPGSAEELFFLDGNGRHGARLTSPLLGFERSDPDLWEWFGSAVSEISQTGQAGQAREVTPFRGLSSFTVEDADRFFGREREAEAFANRLRTQGLLAVVGPSGSGKSSFIQAGVVPLVPAWRTLTVRPGATPLEALRTRLEAAHLPAPSVEELARSPEALKRALAGSVLPGQFLLLVVDQFEELITLCQSPQEREAYAAALVALVSDATEPFRVVLTLRDDFLIRTQQVGPLREKLGQGLQLLGTPVVDDLVRIVTEPARRVGYAFEDAELVSEMVGAVADQPGALALLSFTASQLWELRDRGFKRLTRSAYRALGGVGGALAQHAEATLGQMSTEESRLTRDAFRSLVTAEGTRAVLSRRELLEVLGSTAQAESAVERLINARLLVSEGEGDARQARVEVIHETLLTSWPRLVKWQREDAEGARMRDQLRAAARQWEQRAKARGVLWRGEALMEYRLWRSRYPGALTALEGAFAAASLREDARGRLIRRSLLVGAFVALAVAVTILIRANGRAERSAQEARVNLAGMHAEQGRLSLLEGQPLQALPYLSKAYDEGIDGPGIRFMLGRGLEVLAPQLLSLEGHTLRASDAAFSPDGRWVISTSDDGTARLWDARTGEQKGPPMSHGGRIFGLAIRPSGDMFATGSRDKHLRLWALPSGQLLRTFDAPAEVNHVRFTPDGARVIGGTWNGSVWIWQIDSDSPPLQVAPGLQGPVGWLSLSGAGDLLAVAGHASFGAEPPVATLWDVHTGEKLQTLVGHTKVVGAVAVSRDGTRVVTGSNDGTARVWDAQTGKNLVVVNAAQGNVVRVAVSPDGTSFATAGDHNGRLWRMSDGTLLATLSGHLGDINDIVYSSDGSRVATASADGTARLWDARNGRHRMTYYGHVDAILRVHFDAEGARLVTASQDLSVKVWDARQTSSRLIIPGDAQDACYDGSGKTLSTVDDKGVLRQVDASTGEVLGTHLLGPTKNPAWSRDRRWVFTDGNGIAGMAAVWDSATGMRVSTLDGAGIGSGAFDPSGERLATVGADGKVRTWDVRSGELLRTLGAHAGLAIGVAWRPDGKMLASGGADSVIHFWDPEGGRDLGSLRGQLGLVLWLGFSPDGTRLLSTSSDGSARLWNLATNALERRLLGHHGFLTAAAFDPRGRFFATGGDDGFVSIWDATTGRQLERLEMGETVMGTTFDPSGGELLAAAKHHLRVWRLSSEIEGPRDVTREVACRVPYRLDGDYLTAEAPRCPGQR